MVAHAFFDLRSLSLIDVVNYRPHSFGGRSFYCLLRIKFDRMGTVKLNMVFGFSEVSLFSKY